ncbi:MAG: SagB/ThcOx family dehydrogenase [Pseudomonadota bacterium]|nr:SagB/ThcOx family dehydrogenase [Pseudomonadota bacterium]
MTAPADDPAPLFDRFWLNGTLNPTQAERMAERIGRDAARPASAPQPRHARAAMPLPPPRSALAPLYGRRASGRAFGPAPLTPAQLSTLLLPLAARPDGTRHLPSGGAKYPLLAWGALYAVTGVAELAGQRVAYAPTTHALTPLGPVPPWPDMARALGVDWPTPPASVWLLAAASDALQRKYGERGGRFLLLEAGAMMGALALQAAELGLAGVPIGSYHDDALLRLFGLDGRGWPAVIVYACGAPAKKH